MTIRSITMMNGDGEILIHRNFIGFLTTPQLDLLQSYVLKADFSQPIYQTQSICVVHAHVNTLHVFANCTPNGDAMVASYFLQKFIEVLKSFIPGLFDRKSTAGNLIALFLDENDLILRNQILIQELLEEMVDNGEIVTTDPSVLQLFIQSGKPTVQKMKEQDVTIQATKQSNYRPSNLFYKNNSIVIDVVETLNASMNAVGKTLESTSQGSVEINCQLSGMPDCNIQLNDKAASSQYMQKQSNSNQKSIISLDDVSFHHCVRLNNFQAKRQITFVPPDGKFSLMKFRITQQVDNPFNIHIVTTNSSKHCLQLIISLKGVFSQEIKAQKVLVSIPTPPDLCEAACDASAGTAKLAKSGKFVEWRMASLHGATEQECRIELKTATGVDARTDVREWRRPSCRLNFEIPQYSASGIQIVNVNVVDQSGYEVSKSCTTKTVAGAYEIKW